MDTVYTDLYFRGIAEAARYYHFVRSYSEYARDETDRKKLLDMTEYGFTTTNGYILLNTEQPIEETEIFVADRQSNILDRHSCIL